MTPRGDMAIWNFPNMCQMWSRSVVGRSSVGRWSVLNIYFLHCSHILLFATLGTWHTRSKKYIVQLSQANKWHINAGTVYVECFPVHWGRVQLTIKRYNIMSQYITWTKIYTKQSTKKLTVKLEHYCACSSTKLQDYKCLGLVAWTDGGVKETGTDNNWWKSFMEIEICVREGKGHGFWERKQYTCCIVVEEGDVGSGLYWIYDWTVVCQ